MTIVQTDPKEDQSSSVELSPPEISHLDRDTFQYKGSKYLSMPTISEFLIEAGIANIHVFRQIMRELQIQEIITLEDMGSLNKSQLLQLESVNPDVSRRITQHLVRIKHQGPLLLHGEELKKLEQDFYYLEFEKKIDELLFSHITGKRGIRSKSIIELCGDEGVGKTQWCMTATSSMLQVGRKVVYIDSEGGFAYSRIKQIANQNQLSQRSIRDNIIYAQIDSFDELDMVLDQLSSLISQQNVGMIIIDSIMQLLQNTYPVDNNWDNLAERQLHLRKTMRKLRSMARYHNLIIIYTNHIRDDRYAIRQDIGEDLIEEDDLKTVINLLKRLIVPLVPMGGHTLAHSSDIRIYLTKKVNNGENIVLTATLENCSYLPKTSLEYSITIGGIEPVNNQLLSRTKHEIDSNKDHRKKLNDLIG